MREIDLLVVGQNYVMVVEAKWRINADTVREFVERLSSLPEFFPEFAGYKVTPVVAGVNIDPSVVTFLNRQKVYGVAMADETMELINLGQFTAE